MARAESRVLGSHACKRAVILLECSYFQALWDSQSTAVFYKPRTYIYISLNLRSLCRFYTCLVPRKSSLWPNLLRYMQKSIINQ